MGGAGGGVEARSVSWRELLRDGRDPCVTDPAGDDELEALERVRDVQREAVRRDPARASDADRGDLRGRAPSPTHTPVRPSTRRPAMRHVASASIKASSMRRR